MIEQPEGTVGSTKASRYRALELENPAVQSIVISLPGKRYLHSYKCELLNEKTKIIYNISWHAYKIRRILPSIKAGTAAKTENMASNMLTLSQKKLFSNM